MSASAPSDRDGRRRPSVTERARRDLAAGRAWSARDRLGSRLAATPADPEVRELLGQVHARMGDLPAAGQTWFLTSREDAEAQAAIAAYRYRNDLGGLLATIPPRVPLEEWPPAVQERLRRLEREAAEAGLAWRPGASPRPSPRDEYVEAGWVAWIVGTAIVVAIVASLVVGVVTIVGWMV